MLLFEEGALKVKLSCFKSNAVLICADVDGLVLFEEGALKVIVACFPLKVVVKSTLFNIMVFASTLLKLASFPDISPSFNKTLSIATPDEFVFSFIVSVDNVPLIDISPPSPVNKIVSLLLLFFTSKSLKLPCLDAETKLVPPTA